MKRLNQRSRFEMALNKIPYEDTGISDVPERSKLSAKEQAAMDNALAEAQERKRNEFKARNR